MPELPEVETVRRTLEAALVGRRVERARVRRPDYVHGGRTHRDLLVGGVVDRLERHGKQFAVVVDDGRAACVHLGMSGQAMVAGAPAPPATHVHVEWRLSGDGRAACVWLMRDPRRFGGVWTFGSFEELVATRWRRLGPDGLTVEAAHLRRAFAGSDRCVKAALLDQTVVAGVGNIYCDEALHRARIRPGARAGGLGRERVSRLAIAIRETLEGAIEARGSTIRDYRDANGEAGGYRSQWKVYGRSGEACQICGRTLSDSVIAQRTTVWCARCQR